MSDLITSQFNEAFRRLYESLSKLNGREVPVPNVFVAGTVARASPVIQNIDMATAGVDEARRQDCCPAIAMLKGEPIRCGYERGHSGNHAWGSQLASGVEIA
jgi:hypothetical protein